MAVPHNSEVQHALIPVTVFKCFFFTIFFLGHWAIYNPVHVETFMSNAEKYKQQVRRSSNCSTTCKWRLRMLKMFKNYSEVLKWTYEWKKITFFLAVQLTLEMVLFILGNWPNWLAAGGYEVPHMDSSEHSSKWSMSEEAKVPVRSLIGVSCIPRMLHLHD